MSKIHPAHTLKVYGRSRWRKYDGPYAMFYDLSNRARFPTRDHELDRQLDVWVLQSVERSP